MEFEICLNRVHFYGYHGVLEEENRLGNEFIVDLRVDIETCGYFEDESFEDNIESTVSYLDLYRILEDEMKVPRKLLESVAYHVAKRIKSDYPEVKRGEIRIEKKRPPIAGMIGSASVSLKF